MYCGNCGKPAQPGDKFCESCGARLEQPTAPVEASRPPAMRSDAPLPAVAKSAPRQPLSRKTKIWMGAVGGTIVVLGAAYMILRMTYGPSNPEELAKQLNASVDAQNVKELAKYLDDSSSPLLAADRMELFQAALKNESVRKTYKSGILEAISAAEMEEAQPDKKDTFSDKLREELQSETEQLPDSWMTFIKETSWRGSKWSVHITPVELYAEASEADETLHSSVKIGALTAKDQERIQNLWPATYAYTGALSSDYGSQAYDGSVDAYDYVSPNPVSFDTSRLNVVRLQFPPFAAKVTLNGKDIQGTPGSSRAFQPVPKDVELTISGKVYGMELSGKTKIDAAQEQNVDLQELLQKPAAEKAADLTYAAFDSWVKATNAGNPGMLKDYNPEGSFADYMTWELENGSGEHYALKQIKVDPSSVSFNEDSMDVDIAASYASSQSPDEVKTDTLNLRIAQQPGQNNWWIDSYSTTYMSDDESALVRDNAGFDAEAAKLGSAAGTAGQSTSQASASGAVSFTQEEAQDFMRTYVSSSVEAINQRDFSVVSYLMDSSGPAYQESSDYIGYLETKGITEEFVDAVVTKLQDHGDSTYTVYTTESYIIHNKENEANARTYNSVYKLSTIDGQLRAHTLISTKEVK
ncbi:hypothetical protein B9G55_16830 [Saccharibacillus sp. O16]|nr:hypothetical protein B9G55_16830 [Saccharibacillus sp. O16]